MSLTIIELYRALQRKLDFEPRKRVQDGIVHVKLFPTNASHEYLKLKSSTTLYLTHVGLLVSTDVFICTLITTCAKEQRETSSPMSGNLVRPTQPETDPVMVPDRHLSLATSIV